MKAKKRWVVYLGFLVVFYLLGTFGLRNLLILPSFATLEREEALRDVRRATLAIDRELLSLSRTAKDYASWSELATYVANPVGEFLTSELKWDYLEETLEVHLICLTDLQGRIIWKGTGGSVEDVASVWGAMEAVAPSRKSSALRRLVGDDGAQGLLPTDQGILMLASQSIQSVGSTDPVTGILIMGRFLDGSIVTGLVEQTHVDFRIERLDGRKAEVDIAEIGPDLLRASSPLLNLWQEPAAILIAEVPRTIMARGRDAARIGAISMALAITLIGVVAVLLIRRTTELEKLANELSENRDELRRQIAQGTEELARRERAEEALQSIEAQLRQAQKMEAIGALAGGIAHDFNNLLQIMLGYLDLARSETSENSQVTESLDEAITAGKRAVELVEQILAFSRQSKSIRRALPIQPIIEELLKLLRPSMVSTIEIRRSIDESCRPVLADATEVHQVIMNLCTNAVHAMGDGGGVLELVLEEAAADMDFFPRIPSLDRSKMVLLSVRDTGSGMDAKTVERIFDPYFTTKEVGEGMGVGLATVKGIVESCGGTIMVSSELGIGTRFDVYLPIAPDEEMPDDSNAEEGLEPKGSECLLFVDDEPMIVEQAKLGLAHLGFEVQGCSSSLEAWKLFQESPDRFDVVITDQMMPNLTGLQLARQLSRIRPKLPVILCTGFSELVDEETARAAGISRYARKPILPRALAKAVREILDEEEVG